MSINIIAEIGINWTPFNFDEAKRMIRLSKEAGAKIVKFQCFHQFQTAYLELELPLLGYREIKDLKEYCDEIGIKFACTPFNLFAAETLEELDCGIYKIRQFDNQNHWLINQCLRTKKLVIISYKEGDKLFTKEKVKRLRVINKGDRISNIDFNFFDGISSHETDPNRVIKAISRGAKIVEQHVKLHDDCPDANVSMTFEQLKEVCDFAIRHEEYD